MGLNPKLLPWSWNGTPRHEHIRANWLAKRADLERRVVEVEGAAR